MTTHDPLLPAVVLQRKAVVYVRQSTQQQVQLNLESQRRQYELAEVASRRGFTNIEVIDEDLVSAQAQPTRYGHHARNEPASRACLGGRGHRRRDGPAGA